MAKTRSKNPKGQRATNATLRNPIEAWLADAIVQSRSSSGEPVSPRDMLAYPPAWHCINKICGHVGYLPLNLYERDATDERKKKLAERLASYWVTKHQSNPLMSPQTVRETMQAHALWAGNGRAFIQRNMRGEPIGLWPLPPSRCETMLIETGGEDGDVSCVVEGKSVAKWHLLRDDDGSKLPIPDRDVLHIAGLGYDGVQGYSIIDLAREWLGLAKAQNKAVGGNFRSGSRPSFMLEAPPGVFKTADDAKAYLANFRAQHEGVENEGKVGLLTGGVAAKAMQISARESQWQEQRIFSRQDAAIWFAVEQMLGDDSSVSYRSLEEKNRAYVTNCLMRWLTKWEQECWQKLLTTQQQYSMRYYFRFRVEALLRGTTLDRYQVYQLGRQMRVLSANDVRESEDMDPIEGGDVYDNPSIDTQDASTDKTQPDTEAVKARLRAMISNRLSELQAVEIQRVKDAATKPVRFVQWVDAFYSGGQFPARVASTWSVCGLSEAVASEYCDASKESLLNAAGECHASDLPHAISHLVDAWPERLNTIAAAAVGG